MSPPKDLSDFIKDPLHSLFYVSFVIFTCGFFAKFWIQISGESSKDVAKKLKDE